MCIRDSLPEYGAHSTYGVRVTRTPLALAALASAAVPGLDPATVKGAAQRPGHQFEVAFIEDTQHRRWVVRAPMTVAAGAHNPTAMLRVFDEGNLELMSGTLRGALDCGGVEAWHCGAGEGGEGKGSASHCYTVCRVRPILW